jgi:predicted enzyme related to lactoylglutathione lyase
MSAQPSQFVWYELMTSDLAGAEAFYAAVLGWTLDDAGMPTMRYRLASAPGGQVAGLMTLPDDAKAAGATPGWIGYIGVDHVDSAVDAAKAAGGFIHKAPADIPGVGRFAIVADPNHLAFAIFQPLEGGSSAAFALGQRGHAGWNELHSTDWQKGWDFYATLFGWSKGDTMDMGPMGVYQLFHAGGEAGIGAMFNSPAPHPGWLFYWNVEDIDAATRRVTDNGGTVQMGPVEVPGPMWVIQALDPQGVAFALVGQRTS